MRSTARSPRWIHVAPFTISESRIWLAQRALGIPEPFVWLCHCLSGGLPRDLGRVAIALHDLKDECPELVDMTRALVQHELMLKVRAFIHTAAQLEPADGDDADQPWELMSHLHKVGTAGIDDLVELAGRIWPTPRVAPTTDSQRLRAEVSCYLAFCQTMTEIFNDDLEPHQLHELPQQGDETVQITDLALARQHMAVDTSLAWNVLDSFRRRRDLLSGDDLTFPNDDDA